MKTEKFFKYVEIKTLLNNQLVKGETTRKNRKCLETNKIKKKKNNKIWDATKVVLYCREVYSNIYIQKRRISNNNLTLYFKELNKIGRKTKSKVNR